MCTSSRLVPRWCPSRRSEVAEETAAVHRRDRRQERRADQRRARLAEQRGAGQVDFTHDAGAIERAIAVRRAVVQLDEAVARLLELVQRLDELLVLRPQLLLVDLGVVAEQRPLVVWGRSNGRGARAAARTSHVIIPRTAWPRSAPGAGRAHPADAIARASTAQDGPVMPADGRTIWRATVPVSHSGSAHGGDVPRRRQDILEALVAQIAGRPHRDAREGGVAVDQPQLAVDERHRIQGQVDDAVRQIAGGPGPFLRSLRPVGVEQRQHRAVDAVVDVLVGRMRSVNQRPWRSRTSRSSTDTLSMASAIS